MTSPTQAEFEILLGQGKAIPFTRTIPLEELTPISLVEKLGLIGQPFALLESGQGGAESARHSILAFWPWQIFRSKGENIQVFKDLNCSWGQKGEATIEEERWKESPYLALQSIVEKERVVNGVNIPKFCGGAVGYISYDMGRNFEKLPVIAVDDLDLPESYFLFSDYGIIIDHLDKTLTMVVRFQLNRLKEEQDFLTTYETVINELDELEGLIKAPQKAPAIPMPVDFSNRAWQKKYPTVNNVSKEEFIAMVDKAKEYILAGDIFQVNLSLRVQQEITTDSWLLYKILREINPSPYMGFMDFGELQIVSSSPELLVRLRGDLAETRPIAGTRRRGTDRDEDLRLAKELINHEKERAEHIMLVDLERNDLGRVCKFGSVEVNELMVIEEYSHVMHIVSNVRGELRTGENAFTVLEACFPGGTITGAPKIRSMEIIEELEPTRRGLYTGSMGYFAFNGDMEMNISIRTIVVKDGQAYAQAGAGVVADSVPEREYYESLKKAEAMLRALELAKDLTLPEGGKDK